MVPTSSHSLRAIAIVPARLASTRLPRKMLLEETGRPLFAHTIANVARARTLERVVLATDSEEILAAARAAGIEAVLTDPAHPCGTDRVHEALVHLVEGGAGPFDVVVNVQGDEPELPPEAIDQLVLAMRSAEVEVATLAAPLERPGENGEHEDPAIVKVVLDRAGNALYFSRAAIPSRARAPSALPASPLRHVGVYAFRPAALARFCASAPGALERIEQLEQLRWLESGGRMRVVTIARAPHGIDTPEQYAAFVRRATRPFEGSKP